MDPARYARLHEIFAGASPLAEDARRAYIHDACGDDGTLQAEVVELLAWAQTERDPAEPLYDPQLAAIRARLEEALTPTALERAAETDIPMSIGRFRIVRRIASGGMGVVYEAEQDAPRRRVALKVISAQRTTPERRRRFRQEAELLGRLQHPAIAQIHEAGTFDLGEGEQPFFAMEFVDGVDVCTHADRAHLDLRGRLILVAEIAEAVQYAHEMGVIHRDLKPDNVLVDARGRAKVLDFGVARATERPSDVSTIVTQEGQLVGTLGYMAPEQLRGLAGAITPRVDVYALGVIAFHLLTGRMPHIVAGLPMSAAIERLANEDAPRAGAIVPALRGDVETILATALALEPERRYATAAAFAADIRNHLDDRAINARPPSLPYLAAKFARRHRRLVTATAISFTALAAATVISLGQARKASRERDDARAANIRADTVRKFLIDMIRGANPVATRGEQVTLRQMLEHASREIESGTITDPMVEAELRHEIGNVYGWLGEYESARLHFDRAAKLFTKLHGPQSIEATQTVYALAHFMIRANRLEEAEQALEAHVAAFGDAEPHKTFANLLYAHGELLMRLGRPADAAREFERAIAVYDASGSHGFSYTTAIVKLAVAQERAGQDAAVPLLREAIDRYVQSDTNADATVRHGYLLLGLADVLESQGHLEEAESELVRSLELLRAAYPNDEHPDMADTLRRLGSVERRLGKHDLAEASLIRAHRVMDGLAGADDARTQRIAKELAEFLAEQGREAEALEWRARSGP